MKPLRTAVIPAGGLGTRFLPFTRTVPKELLPLVDTPVLDLVVADCVAAGVERVIIVTAPGKESLEAYFQPNERLAARLAADGRTAELELLRRPERADVRIVIQREPRGNGHAVSLARDAVGDEPFLVIWPDDLVRGGPGELVAARERLGSSVAGALRVPRAEVGRYGMLVGDPIDDRTLRLREIVEKPAPDRITSDVVSVHGYALEPSVFDALADLGPGRGGEIWLADAVAVLVAREAVWASVLAGARYDTGDRPGYAAAFVDAALERPDTGPALRAHLTNKGWKPPTDR